MKRLLSLFLSAVMLMTVCCGAGLHAFADSVDTLYTYTVRGDESSGYYVSIDKYKQAQSYEYSDINIPAEILGSPVTEIGARAFIGAWNLETIGIPHTVKTIGARAFLGCSFVSEFVMSSSELETIGEYAFANCASLTSFNIPATVTSIGSSAFMGCDDLRTITVSEGNANYASENGVLYNIDKTELIKIPSAYSVQSFTVPDTVTKIAADAIYNNPNSSIQTLIIPASVTEIEESAIDANPSLETIYYLGSESDWNANVTVGEDNAELESKLVFHPEHDLVQQSYTPPTCTEDGSRVSVCSVCGAVVTETIAALEHNYEVTDHKDASYTEAGYDVYTCSNCGDSYTVEIPKLDGIIISVTETTLGTAQITGGAEYDGSGRVFEAGEEFTLTAIPNDNADFIGWAIGNRIVSESTLYRSFAYTSLEFTPVFTEKETEETQTIVFMNKYGDILSTQKAGSVEIPYGDNKAALNLPGYVFTGWRIKGGAEISDEEIINLEKSTTLVGVYEKNSAAAGYTITAEGAVITLPDGVENGSIPFDTRAVVTFENASAIKCGEDYVAYGDTYSFYVGGDITLTAEYDSVDEAVSVKIVGANRIEGTATKFNVYATRVVPEGWTAIDRGFVYGLEANVPETKEEIDLDNLPNGCRVSHGTPTASEQFALKVGISSGKRVKFYAYVTVQQGEETMLVISNPYTVEG